VGLRFARVSGWLGSSEMSPEIPEPPRMDERAYRVRSIIVVVMAILIAAPFVMYLLSGRGLAPRQ
jgi:hypothetical protein